MNPETSMVSYYARRAQEYERIYEKPERQDDLQRLRQIVEAEFAGQAVLEVACGTGYWTPILARTAKSVLATDINEEVLAIARAKSCGPAPVTFEQQDAYAWAGLRDPVQAAFAGFWWSHIPKARRGAFLQGLHRVLPAGGRVVFIDNPYVEGSSTPISRTDSQGDTYQWRRLDDGTTHEVLKNFPTETELQAAVEPWASAVWVEFLRYYWILRFELS